MPNDMSVLTPLIVLMTMFLCPDFSSSVHRYIDLQTAKLKRQQAMKSEDRLKKYYEIDLRDFK